MNASLHLQHRVLVGSLFGSALCVAALIGILQMPIASAQSIPSLSDFSIKATCGPSFPVCGGTKAYCTVQAKNSPVLDARGLVMRIPAITGKAKIVLPKNMFLMTKVPQTNVSLTVEHLCDTNPSRNFRGTYGPGDKGRTLPPLPGSDCHTELTMDGQFKPTGSALSTSFEFLVNQPGGEMTATVDVQDANPTNNAQTIPFFPSTDICVPSGQIIYTQRPQLTQKRSGLTSKGFPETVFFYENGATTADFQMDTHPCFTVRTDVPLSAVGDTLGNGKAKFTPACTVTPESISCAQLPLFDRQSVIAKGLRPNPGTLWLSYTLQLKPTPECKPFINPAVNPAPSRVTVHFPESSKIINDPSVWNPYPFPTTVPGTPPPTPPATTSSPSSLYIPSAQTTVPSENSAMNALQKAIGSYQR